MVKLEKNEKKIYEIPFKKIILDDDGNLKVSRLILTDRYIIIQYYAYVCYKKFRKKYEQIYIDLNSIKIENAYPKIFYETLQRSYILTICYGEQSIDIKIKCKKKMEKCFKCLEHFKEKLCEVLEEKLDLRISRIENKLNDVYEYKVKSFIRKIGPSKTELTQDNLTKMRTLYPIPNEHEIIWADCTFNRRCVGNIITQKGIFVKKVDERNNVTLKYIKFEYIDSSFFDLQTENVDFESLPVNYLSKNQLMSNLENETNAVPSMLFVNEFGESLKQDALNIIGHSNQTQKHGFYAEEANNIDDRLRGKKAFVVGGDNKKDGPDRRIKRFFRKDEYIQTKYCNSPRNTIKAAFNRETGEYRYVSRRHGIMRLEVPKDQYEEAVRLFAKKIKSGKVKTPGGKTITYKNDEDLKKIAQKYVKKGNLTYSQSISVAKAGNVHSLNYDIKHGIVSCKSVFGISFLSNLATTYRFESDFSEALKDSLKNAGEAYISSIAASVVFDQLTKNKSITLKNETKKKISLFDNIKNKFKSGVRKAKKENGFLNKVKGFFTKAFPKLHKFIKSIIGKIKTVFKKFKSAIKVSKKRVSFKAKIKAFFRKIFPKNNKNNKTKKTNKNQLQASNNNLVNSTDVKNTAITILTLSIPDIVKAFSKHITYGQLMKNTIVIAGSVAGGTIGYKIGWSIGAKTHILFGAPIGALIGSIIGQKKGLELAKNKAEELREDDIVIFSYLYYAYIETLTIDYMLDEEEIKRLASILSEVKPRDLVSLNRQFIKNNYSEKIILMFLDKKFKRVVSSRPKVYENEIIETMATLAIAQN